MTMTYDIAIGDRSYSSWSLRGWLMFDAFDIPVTVHLARLYTDRVQQVLATFQPARTVPVMRTPDGVVVPDSLAIVEELASRHPDAGHWPKDPKARAVARALCAEMHVGFVALRSHCPMNLRASYTNCDPTPEVLTDLARLQVIWDWAWDQTGGTGPWLCGDYCAADAYFAPVAARIAGYNLPVGSIAQEYTAAHLAHPSFRRWRAEGLAEGADQPSYIRSWPQRDWPQA
jgi:glutathione S-transferase